jgi:hypothetical protein
LVLGRREFVQQVPVIGQQQQTRGVLVKAAHWLQPASAQGHRQQVMNPWPGAWFERAFIPCRFVQHHQGLDMGDPIEPVYPKVKPVFRKHGIQVINDLMVHMNQTIDNQTLALAAGTKSFGEKDLAEGVVTGG